MIFILTLINLPDDEWSLSKFGHDPALIKDFLAQHRLDGLEIIRWETEKDTIIPFSKAVGRHLSFWPIWLDFWRSNTEELMRQFGSREACEYYYTATSKEEFVQNYRKELLEAEETGARYVVFHVCHIRLEHCFNYGFTYSDREVVDTFIDMLNEILQGLNLSYHILFENHWFPGFTMLNREIGERLLEKVNYPKTGFVLDIGHLMNTNLSLQTEEEAVEYIMEVLDQLGSIGNKIKTIHLNSSLTGPYVLDSMKNRSDNPAQSFHDRLMNAMKHVSTIDRHEPFCSPSIQKVINRINPDYLVYELSANTLSELGQAVSIQNRALKT